MSQARHTREEIARRGQALYDQRIRDRVEPTCKGKLLAIDVETGEYEIDTDELAALRRATSKKADALLYLLRVGYPAAYRLGGQFRTRQP